VKIFINDEEYCFEDTELKLINVLKKLDVNQSGIIAEVDGKVFNNNELGDAIVKDGSKIELIKIFGGG